MLSPLILTDSSYKGEKQKYMRLIMQYIRDMSWYVVIGFITGLISLAVRYKRRKTKDKKHEILMILFIAYLAGLASQTVVPRFGFGVASNTGKFYFDVYIGSLGHINLIPFRSIAQQLAGEIGVNANDIASVAVLNLAANLLLFSPLGFFLPTIWDKLISFKRTVLAGLCIVVLIEMIQFFIGRSADIDDVILNVVGIAVGYCIYKGVKILLHR